MSVVIETTLGDFTVDLFLKERPKACLNFLKLCKIKYYNYNLFHTVSRNFIAQTGDPTGSRDGGESVFGVLDGPQKRYFQAEKNPRIKHLTMGLVSFVGDENNMIGSQFFITLGTDLTYLDEHHCVFGEVVEGLDVLEKLNEAICDGENRPYQDIRITHTVILDDPFPDPKRLEIPDRSPSPSAERLQGGRIAPDEEIDETAGKSLVEIEEMKAEREAKARATILEMVGDIPDAEMAPPENVLFVCKLNPVTTDDDLEIIFSRFGKIKSCEVIRDKKTGDSLQYAFVEFEDKKSCEDAYFKMDNVLIDDRRIHVDFSQSVAKVKWHGKGRGVTTYDDKGRRTNDLKNDIGQGRYKSKNRIDKKGGRNVRGDKREMINEDDSEYKKKDERYRRDREYISNAPYRRGIENSIQRYRSDKEYKRDVPFRKDEEYKKKIKGYGINEHERYSYRRRREELKGDKERKYDKCTSEGYRKNEGVRGKNHYKRYNNKRDEEYNRKTDKRRDEGYNRKINKRNEDEDYKQKNQRFKNEGPKERKSKRKIQESLSLEDSSEEDRHKKKLKRNQKKKSKISKKKKYETESSDETSSSTTSDPSSSSDSESSDDERKKRNKKSKKSKSKKKKKYSETSSD